jgi:hypothetical protein
MHVDRDAAQVEELGKSLQQLTDDKAALLALQAVASSYCKQLQEEGAKRGPSKWEAIQQAASTPQSWLHETIDAPFTGGRDGSRWTVEVAPTLRPPVLAPARCRHCAPHPRFFAHRGSGSTRSASTRRPNRSTTRPHAPPRATAQRAQHAP